MELHGVVRATAHQQCLVLLVARDRFLQQLVAGAGAHAGPVGVSDQVPANERALAHLWF